MRMLLLLLFLLWPQLAIGQAIKTLADSMTAGTWATLTGVADQPLHDGGSVTGEHLTYAHSGQWDSTSDNGYYVGAGHGVNTAPWIFKYTSSTNAWTKLLELQPLGATPLHNYDHTSFDPWRRRLYIRDTNRIYGFDTATDSWLGQLTSAPYDLGDIAEGTAWFEGLYGSGLSSTLTQGGLVVYSGKFWSSSSGTQIHTWEPHKGTGSGAWSEINGVFSQQTCGASPCGNYHTWSEYSRPYNVVFVGGGNKQPRKIAVLNANRTVTAVTDAPIDVRIQKANAVVDPRSGKLLIYGFGQMWELGLNAAGTAWVWTQLNSPPASITADSGLGDPASPEGSQRSIFSMPIPDYGVMYYVRCQQFDPCRHYLYKHAESDFDIRARQGGVISSRKMDTEADHYYSWNTGDSTCASAFTGRTRYGMTANKGTDLGNTKALTVNGNCNFPRIDRTVKPNASSSGSLLFTSPSMAGQDGGGLWEETLPFGDRTSPWSYIAPGSPMGGELWRQYKVRFNSQQLTSAGEQCFGGGPLSCDGRKVDVVFGNPPNGTNSSTIEITGVIDQRSSSEGLGIPTWYGSGGHDPFPEQSLANCNDGGPYTGCFRYTADTWYTVTQKYTVAAPATAANQGCVGPGRSRLEVWAAVATGGGASTKIMDYGCISINYGSSDGQGIGSIGFWEFVTGRTPTAHAEGRTWIADVIVSTSAIATDSTTPPPDTTPPSPPTNLTVGSVASNQVNLFWTASSDDVGVAGYQVDRCQGVGCSNFTLISSPAVAILSDTTVGGSTTYRYRTRAFDAVPNFSGYSNIVSATTPSGAPASPTNLRRVP